MRSIELIEGDCIAGMRTLDSQSAQTCITSPPYFGLRDYNVDGQIGLESTPAAFVEKLVAVFREVRRVLRDDGTLWVNIGDSYNAHPGQRKVTDTPGAKQATSFGSLGAPSRSVDGLKPKDIIGVPWMLAFALRADGWYLRQDIIWHKPNPMPESVQDRCTKSHEYIFLLSKSERYYFDSEAIAEPAAYAGQMRGGSTNRYEQNASGMDSKVYDTRNKRSVWTVKPAKSEVAHFAAYPPELIEPCVLAGAPKGGVVLDPFGGTGTTVLAAAKLGRLGVTTELNPKYCEIIRKRIERYECREPGNLFASLETANV